MVCCRIDVFTAHYGYQAWNPDVVMEKAMARLPGSGSFYWPTAREAYREAVRLLKRGARQAKIETISGRPVCRLYGPDERRPYIRCYSEC